MIWIALAVSIAALVAYRLTQSGQCRPLAAELRGLRPSTTTGSDPDRHEIIEIGALRVEPRRDCHGFPPLAWSRPRREIPARVTELTGITQIGAR